MHIFIDCGSLRFLMDADSESLSVGELKTKIEENFRQSFPLREPLNVASMRLREKHADYYLTDGLKFPITQSEHWPELVLELEEKISGSRNFRDQATQTTDPKPPPPAQVPVPPRRSKELAEHPARRSEISTIDQGDLFESRAEATTMLCPDTWTARSADDRKFVVSGFRDWVSKGEGDVWETPWKRELILEAIRMDPEIFLSIVVEAVEKRDTEIPCDSFVLELLRVVRKEDKHGNCTLRLINALLDKDTKMRSFLVKFSPGLANFLCACLKDEALEIPASQCIGKCAFEFEFRAKLKLNAHIHSYLIDPNSRAEARRLVLLALENSLSCLWEEHNSKTCSV